VFTHTVFAHVLNAITVRIFDNVKRQVTVIKSCVVLSVLHMMQYNFPGL